MTVTAKPAHKAALKTALAVGTAAALTPVVKDIVSDGYQQGVDAANMDNDPAPAGLAAKLASLGALVTALVGSDGDPSDIADGIATDAAHTGTMDTYGANGITQFNVHDPGGNPCPICQAEIDDNPHDIGNDYPIYHENCSCLTAPVQPEGRSMNAFAEDRARLHYRTKWDAKSESKALAAGHALKKPDGSVALPIEDHSDVADAVTTAHFVKGIAPDKVHAHIAVQAKRIGALHLVPKAWGGTKPDAAETKSRKQRHRSDRARVERAYGTEFRTHVDPKTLEVRASNEGETYNLSGRGLVYGLRTPITDHIGTFGEVNERGCVQNLKTADVRLLIGHDSGSIPLARTASGTMQLRDEPDGLYFDAQLSSKSVRANDLADAASRGDISGVSVGFLVPEGGDTWNANYTERTIHQMNLIELSCVAFPAVEATSLELMQRAMAQVPEETRARLQVAYRTALDIRAGKVVSAENKAHLAATLEHLSAAAAHVQTVHDANGKPNGQGNGVPGEGGDQGDLQSGLAPGGGGTKGDGSGSGGRSVFDIDRAHFASAEGRRLRALADDFDRKRKAAR